MFSMNEPIYGTSGPILTWCISNNLKILFSEKSIFVKIGPRMLKLFTLKKVNLTLGHPVL